MPPHKLFFIGSFLFALGVLTTSLGLSFWFILFTTLVAFTTLIYHSGWHPVVFMALLIIVGGFYYLVDDYRYFENLSMVGSSGEFKGVIVSDPKHNDNSQLFYLKAEKDSTNPNVKILVKTDLSPEYYYGDELIISGKIERPSDDYYGKYLAKEKVHGVATNPQIKKMASGKGNAILATLFKIKNGIRESFKKVLGYKQAAFLSGVILGITDDFSKELLNEFSLSGTRHLTAISGMNMTMITILLLALFSYLMPRKYAFILSSMAIAAFTAMIGFELSAFRAAIMGFISGASRTIVGRPYAVYNAIALTAIIMILINPKVLVFDVGFELSFLAVVAIVYLAPALQLMLNISKDKGLLNWKELLTMTAAAQMATAPILITQFHNFSLVSCLANVLVLPAIPIITWLGFLIGSLGFISYYLTIIPGLIVIPLIEYVLLVIRLSAKLSVIFDPNLNWLDILIYYSILVFLVYFSHQYLAASREVAKERLK